MKHRILAAQRKEGRNPNGGSVDIMSLRLLVQHCSQPFNFSLLNQEVFTCLGGLAYHGLDYEAIQAQ